RRLRPRRRGRGRVLPQMRLSRKGSRRLSQRAADLFRAAAHAMNVVHFAAAADFRRWLEKNHERKTELQVGFYKKSANKPGMSYKEAVDEALCFGWIDGVVRKLDEERFTHRFTPRKSDSIWSNINVGHVERLTQAGRMRPAGLAAFAARSA